MRESPAIFSERSQNVKSRINPGQRYFSAEITDYPGEYKKGGHLTYSPPVTKRQQSIDKDNPTRR